MLGADGACRHCSEEGKCARSADSNNDITHQTSPAISARLFSRFDSIPISRLVFRVTSSSYLLLHIFVFVSSRARYRAPRFSLS